MIPKVIHYCWFGGNPKSEIIEKCVASWKKYCPDWKIIEWNETNYDVNAHPYTRDAYEAKKWAFVSDVARLEVIMKYGGVYLDTDVEILSPAPFDDLLEYDNILVFETERAIATGLCLGGHAGSELCQKLLEPYLNSSYSKDTEQVNSMVNKPVFLSQIPNLAWDGQNQLHGRTYIMGTDDYGKRMKHYGTRSWCDDLPEYTISGFWRLKKFLRNPKFISFLESSKLLRKIAPIYIFLVYDLLDLGPLYYVRRITKKIKSRTKK